MQLLIYLLIFLYLTLFGITELNWIRKLFVPKSIHYNVQTEEDGAWRLPTSIPRALCAAPVIDSVGGIQTAPPVKEAKTGILFPVLCNGYLLAGTGVRVKWGLIQVYAVGTYLDPLSLAAVKNSGTAAVEQALLDPTYPRTIRIVMARGLSMQKFTDSIAEALEPRMKGQDLEK